MNLQIRPFQKNDLNDLVQLTLLAFEPVFTSFAQILGPKIYPIIYPDWRKRHAEGVEKLSTNEKISLWVAEVDGKVIGFIAYTPEKISQLYVHIDHQDRRVGSHLLDIAKQNSHGGLRLFTFERNKSAQRFYESRGFRIVARGFEESMQLEDIEYEWCAEQMGSSPD